MSFELSTYATSVPLDHRHASAARRHIPVDHRTDAGAVAIVATSHDHVDGSGAS